MACLRERERERVGVWVLSVGLMALCVGGLFRIGI